MLEMQIPEHATIVAGNMQNGIFEKKVSEPVDTDPNRRSFQLKKSPDGEMDFSRSMHYAPKEHVCIQAVGTVPLTGSALGLGFEGEATCVFDVRNDWDYQFRATPALYLAFSDELSNGKAIGPEIPFVTLAFSKNARELCLTFNADGSRTLSDRRYRW